MSTKSGDTIRDGNASWRVKDTRPPTPVIKVQRTAILTGILNHDSILPLPEGYTEDQCKWIVAPKTDNYNWWGWDIDEGGGSMLIYMFHCYVDEDRRIKCYSRHQGDSGDQSFPGQANYMVIGTKEEEIRIGQN